MEPPAPDEIHLTFHYQDDLDVWISKFNRAI
jgi:hypothetical protein